jgi:hypothetical protein
MVAATGTRTVGGVDPRSRRRAAVSALSTPAGSPGCVTGCSAGRGSRVPAIRRGQVLRRRRARCARRDGCVARQRPVTCGPVREPARKLLQRKVRGMLGRRQAAHGVSGADQPVGQPRQQSGYQSRPPSGHHVAPRLLVELAVKQRKLPTVLMSTTGMQRGRLWPCARKTAPR